MGCRKKAASALFFLALLFSCSAFGSGKTEPSSLFLEFRGESHGLFALNKNAVSSRIPAASKSPYLYYRFDESLASALERAGGVSALEIDIASETSDGQENDDAVFLFGFLTENDFEGQRLKTTLDSRPLARVPKNFFKAGICKIALAFPQAPPVGFLCYAQFPVSAVGAKITDAQYGFDESTPRLCFPARGGSASSITPPESIPITDLSPVTANPSLLLSRVADTWRGRDYEVYAWEQFPDILFFDTKNYAVQDEFFKRLAFFAEKKDYRGTLVPDGVLSGQHGFNAHDYSAKTLASFFSLARQTQFPLNARERLLCEILVANGIVVENGEGFSEGEGAVISISQESEDYLRRQFVVHEGLHGLFFTHGEFRDYVAQVYKETDPLCVEFLERYFDVTPSLAYDITDRYLVLNEFMAYVLQQPVSACGAYFSERIAQYIYINRYYPALAKYVRDTRGKGFTEAAEKLSAYLTREWGLAAGRVW